MSQHTEDYSTWDIVKATQYGVIERCKELVEEGFDVRTPDAENITLLHWAAINNRIDIAKYYISVGAIVDVLGGDLMATPLHWAIREGHLQMVVVLMQYGQADPNVRDAEGCAAIHVAVQCQYTHIVAYLIAKGVDPDLYDSNGKTPLMWSAWRSYGVDPTRTLLSLNASPHLKDRVHHNTPLHFAVLSQNTTVVLNLINSGADLMAKNGRNETPLDIAKLKKNVWMTARLTQAMQEKGFEKSSSLFFRNFNLSQTFRQRVTFFTTFFVFFIIGYIFQMSLSSWLLKILLFAITYLAVYAVSVFVVTSHEVNNVLPICISFATKFWVYMTGIFMYWQFIYSLPAQFMFFIASTGMFYFFYKAMKTDPGIIASPEEDKKRTIVKLAESNSLRMDRFCNTCMIVKPLRSKHCAVLNRCVAKFDHYCPWVYNCIGANNHAYFIGYLFFLFLILSWHLYATLQFWHYSCWNHKFIPSMERVRMLPECSPWALWIFINVAMHTVWVSLLLVCQLYQVLVLGVTTNERMNASRYAHFQTSEHGHLEHSPFDRGFIKNTSDFFNLKCFGFCHPLQIDWRTKMTFSPEFNPKSHKGYETV